jgi:hypothetical protein
VTESPPIEASTTHARPPQRAARVTLGIGLVTVAIGFAMLLAVVPAIDVESERYVDVIDRDRVGFALGFVPVYERRDRLERDLDAIAASGARWLRFDFYWAALEPERGRFEWRRADRVVDGARERGLKIVATLAYTPDWARPSNTTDKSPPTDPADFVRFARAAARRYADRGVHVWEVWNEPNTGAFWAPGADPEAYAEMLAGVHEVIHRVDREATVLTGGLAPVGDALDWVSEDGNHMSPWRFLSELYDAGARGTFDAVAHHPYPALPGGPSVSAPGNPFAQTAELHALMVEHGDRHMKVWGTEAGSWTGTSNGAVSELRQGDLAGEMLARWSEWDFVGPFLYYSLRDLGTNPREREDNFGLLRHGYERKEGMDAFEAALR